MTTRSATLLALFAGLALAVGEAFLAAAPGWGILAGFCLILGVSFTLWAGSRIDRVGQTTADTTGRTSEERARERRMIVARYIGTTLLPITVFLHAWNLLVDALSPNLVFLDGIGSAVMSVALFVYVLTRMSIDGRKAEKDGGRP